MFLLRKPILAMSGSSAVRDTVSKAPLTKSVVDRFIPGETTADAVAAVTALRAKGLEVTLDHLGEDTTDRATADATVAAYLDVIQGLAAAGQVAGAEVSVKLSAVAAIASVEEALSLIAEAVLSAALVISSAFLATP